METRVFGRTELRVSALGLGCGAVGGLMVRGSGVDQERGVARALDAGIRFFDTAPGYGDGASETNLGRVLARLRPEIVLATKVMIPAAELGEIGGAIRRSVEASLRRLQRDRVDILQLHNSIGAAGRPESIAPEVVIGEVVPAFEQLRAEGKIGFLGFTGVGQTAAVLEVADSGRFDSAQVAYSLLNPSPAVEVPAGFPGQDFGRLIPRATAAGMGTIGIRALAGGALSGSLERHPIATPTVAPIGTGHEYAADVARARDLEPLLAEFGAADLVELALRFSIAASGPTVVLVGVATVEQLDHAIAAVERGALPPDAWARLAPIWAAMAGAPMA